MNHHPLNSIEATALNESGKRLCDRCGTWREPIDLTAPDAANMRFCRTCASIVGETTRCTRCGINKVEWDGNIDIDPVCDPCARAMIDADFSNDEGGCPGRNDTCDNMLPTPQSDFCDNCRPMHRPGCRCGCWA